MALPQVVAVAAHSPAGLAGVEIGDEIQSMNGRSPRDVIEFQALSDEPAVELELTRGGLGITVLVDKRPGEPLGLEVSSPVFDRVRTCDNHCSFCFIYQLPKQMRKSLYVKDDDYRLSFLYGNFTTLTRFTELDLERVVTERLSPLNVSIHTTDPELRSRMLRNRRGATSLRWLRQLLDNGIEVHGQIVVCPGVNDGVALHETFAGLLDRFPDLASAAVVPLGVSRFSKEAEMRSHTIGEAVAVLEAVEEWRGRFLSAVGRRVVSAADEYYLLAGRPFPPADAYDDFAQHENGIGMARTFAAGFLEGSPGLEGSLAQARRPGGFFQSVDAAPATGYRAPRTRDLPVHLALAGGEAAKVGRARTGAASSKLTVLTGVYGERVLRPLLRGAGYEAVELLSIENRFFGGNIAVTGLLTGEDVSRALLGVRSDRRYLLPDVCLSEGRFLDGVLVEELPVPVEVVETDGSALRKALDEPGQPPGRRRLTLAVSPALAREPGLEPGRGPSGQASREAVTG